MNNRTIIVGIIGAVLYVEYAHADEIRWINPSDGMWQEASNWEGGLVPGAGDIAVFDDPVNRTVTFSDDGFATTIRINQGNMIFDLNGFAMINNPDPFATGKLVMAAEDEDASLTIQSGSLFHNPASGCSEVFVDGLDSHLAHLTLASDVHPLSGDDAFYLMVGQNGVVVNSSGHFGGYEPIVDGVMHLVQDATVGWYYGCGELYIAKGVSLVVYFDIAADTIFMASDSTLQCEDIELCNGDLYLETNCSLSVFEIIDSTIHVPVTGVSVGNIGRYEPHGYENAKWNLKVADLSLPLITGSGIDFGGTVDIEFVDQIPGYPMLVPLAAFGHPGVDGHGVNDLVELGSVSPELDADLALIDQVGGTWLRVAPPGWCPADLTFDGQLDFFDVSAFVNYYQSQSPWANLDLVGPIDFFDVSAFIDAFVNGCN